MNTISEVLSNIEQFENMCKEKNVTLVLATKTIPKEFLQEIVDAHSGELIFGENKAQEFKEKYFESQDLKWHFIGRLQTNKVKYLVGKVDLIESVDSKELLDVISSKAEKLGVVCNVLIEVNLGEDPSKGGVDSDECLSLVEYARSIKGVNVKGIMSVLPIGADVMPLMQKATSLSKKLVDKYDPSVGIISIGMSEDYLEAIEGQSNMIRIGSAIFGKRSYQV